MKIIQLTAENVKRLKAIEITPAGAVQVITGRNAQGKTSVLDAIWLALGGGAAAKDTQQPVRDGQEQASVALDLGDIQVIRTWKNDTTHLTVTNADGARYSSPQGMLNALIGRLAFDPLEFTRLPAREQREALLDLVELEIDLEEVDQRRAEIYAQRTETARALKALGDQDVDPDLPAEEESIAEVFGQLSAAQGSNRQRAEAFQAVAAAEDRIRRLELELQTARAEREAAEHRAEQFEHIDLDPLHERIRTLDERNSAIRANNTARARAEQASALRDRRADLTEQIDRLDREKEQALAAAQFPVPGLGFDQDGVTYNGVPFSQASAAEQIRVSLAMAMALNPRLRVIRILDGSLLDDESMETITKMAEQHDYQVWIERVNDTHETAIRIEDGAIAEKEQQ